MTDQMSLKEITNIISIGNTEMAISSIIGIVDYYQTKFPDSHILRNAYELIIIKSAEYHNLKNQTRAGIIAVEKSQIFLNSINKTLLEVLSQLVEFEEKVNEGNLSSTPAIVNLNTTEDYFQIEITIDLPFKDYDPDFIKEIIEKTLQFKGDLRITNIRKGSIKVTIEVQSKDVVPLTKAILNKHLSSFYFTDVNIIVNQASQIDYLRKIYPKIENEYPNLIYNNISNKYRANIGEYIIITFDELRKIKNQLPKGAILFIARELNYTVQMVRNYFGSRKIDGYSIPDMHHQPGWVEGGLIIMGERRVLEIAHRIIYNKSKERIY